jgi:hypothetical protein
VRHLTVGLALGGISSCQTRLPEPLPRSEQNLVDLFADDLFISGPITGAHQNFRTEGNGYWDPGAQGERG